MLPSLSLGSTLLDRMTQWKHIYISQGMLAKTKEDLRCVSFCAVLVLGPDLHSRLLSGYPTISTGAEF